MDGDISRKRQQLHDSILAMAAWYSATRKLPPP
jgi:hypothetical protein